MAHGRLSTCLRLTLPVLRGPGFEGASSGRATLEKRRSEVAAMFDRVAARYDLANDVLSLGQDRAWRRQVVAAASPAPGS